MDTKYARSRINDRAGLDIQGQGATSPREPSEAGQPTCWALDAPRDDPRGRSPIHDGRSIDHRLGPAKASPEDTAAPSLSRMAAPGTWPAAVGNSRWAWPRSTGPLSSRIACSRCRWLTSRLLQGLSLLRALPARCAPYSLTNWGLGCYKWGPLQPADRRLSEAISRRGSMTMKAWKLTAGSLALTAVLAGAMPAQAQAPIKVGASISLTGTYAKPGSYQKEGYDLCAEEVNAKGGRPRAQGRVRRVRRPVHPGHRGQALRAADHRGQGRCRDGPVLLRP